MIAKAKTVAYTFNSISYAHNKTGAKELDRNLLVGETPGELTNEFLVFQKLNNRAEKNTFSFVLSPDDRDSRNFTKKEWKDITHDFLKKMELEDHQWIAYKHNDNRHNHLHIYVNRINERGEAANDSYISNRASRAAEEIAQERKMYTAKDIQKEKQRKQSNKYRKVYEAHKEIIKGCTDLNEYINLMEKKGYRPNFKISNSGKAVGVKFEVNGEMVKGSAIHRSMSGGNIEKAIHSNKNLKQQNTITNKPKQNMPQERNNQPSFAPKPTTGFNATLNNSDAADGDEEEKRKRKKKYKDNEREL
jgi:hypothetical protein